MELNKCDVFLSSKDSVDLEFMSIISKGTKHKIG